MVLDIRMPELSGLDLQEQLLRADYSMPIIFITGHGDVPMTVQAMKRGAIDFLLKPVEREQLLESYPPGPGEGSGCAVRARQGVRELQERLQLLKTREREVMSFVIAGLLNKQIAGELGITEATVKVHRGSPHGETASDVRCRIGGFCSEGRNAGRQTGRAVIPRSRQPLRCPCQRFD